jgi:hypothetical protein
MEKLSLKKAASKVWKRQTHQPALLISRFFEHIFLASPAFGQIDGCSVKDRRFSGGPVLSLKSVNILYCGHRKGWL